MVGQKIMNILRKSIFLYIIYNISMSFGCTTDKPEKTTQKEAVSSHDQPAISRQK